ncbi:protein PHLOEM PROTEIN 2-LIKE A1-like [Pistacia vera]|uniref:protein PHLOEM PROTEIN 2-LIKE A1-like n=1 Tax=Pistacia vera TaxID=55513 RepID=UPI001263A3B1|nr:protein PHLOEM PROTEIN 2-LIKE A1-like [Pistacia vera]
MASAQVQRPHNLDAILQEADSQINKSSDNLIEQLHGGIFLNQNKLASPIYLIDCFFHPVEVEVAELAKVCWLDVTKKFPRQNLTPRHTYEVSFVLKKLKGCEGFQNHPMNLKLTLPNQSPMEHKQDLSILPENKWSDIPRWRVFD